MAAQRMSSEDNMMSKAKGIEYLELRKNFIIFLITSNLRSHINKIRLYYGIFHQITIKNDYIKKRKKKKQQDQRSNYSTVKEYLDFLLCFPSSFSSSFLLLYFIMHDVL